MSSLPRRLPYVRLGKEDDSIISSNLPFQKKKKKKLLYLLFRFCRTSRISIIFSRSIWIIVVIFWKLKNRKISSPAILIFIFFTRGRNFALFLRLVKSGRGDDVSTFPLSPSFSIALKARDLNRIFGKKEEERELKTASETWWKSTFMRWKVSMSNGGAWLIISRNRRLSAGRIDKRA